MTRTRWNLIRSALLPAALVLSGCRGEFDPLATPSAPDSNRSAASTTTSPTPPQVHPATTEADVISAPPAGARASFRPPDERPRHHDARLMELGILAYRSTRLVLYTDIAPDVARTLPPLVDQIFPVWESYFGPLPPARDGSDYQLTGYLMQNQSRFRDAGLLPVTLPAFAHGKHDAQQFWMNDSEFEYYRRHLLLHEATHCFMQSMGGTTSEVPVWYLEGMAERLATHHIHDDGRATFRVLPSRKEDFVGFGRIPMIERAVAEGRLLSVDDIHRLQPHDFVRNNESYAWAWALCAFADSHPRYRTLFQTLAREYVEEGFDPTWDRLLEPLFADFAAEWELFVRHLCYGYDAERAAVEFLPQAAELSDSEVREAIVVAGRGWQPAGLSCAAGRSYDIAAAGIAVLAHHPRPWDTEPQGISIRYNEGRPIGRLLGVVISDPDPQTGRRRIGDVIDLGRKSRFSSTISGGLYLRINDFWNELDDNSGQYVVTISPAREVD